MKKISLGPVAIRGVDDVRRECVASAVATVAGAACVSTKTPLFRDFVAGPWKTACYDRCRPSTQRGFGGSLKRQLLRAFRSRRLERITRIMAVGWFEAYSRTALGGANNALDLHR